MNPSAPDPAGPVWYADPLTTLYWGDARAVLRALPAESVQTCVTSPPYWGLRDYGIAPQVWGGEPTCAHQFRVSSISVRTGKGGNWQQTNNGPGLATGVHRSRFRGNCRAAGAAEVVTCETGVCACGAWRGSLGLEPTPDLYVQHVVMVFCEVRRVLRRDGTCWLNLGDSFTSGNRPTYRSAASNNLGHRVQDNLPRPATPPGLKPKDLIGLPWRVAFALQADGWWLRADIIWAKPAPMPESVTDRPTRSHEYVFLLAKSPRYYYDYRAIQEPPLRRRASGNLARRVTVPTRLNDHRGSSIPWEGGWRNKRDVWIVPNRPYPGAHFATYPPALIEPCILAGSRPGDVVLDPFHGSGTTGEVAHRLGRRYIGIELNPDYLTLSLERLRQPGLVLPEAEGQRLPHRTGGPR